MATRVAEGFIESMDPVLPRRPPLIFPPPRARLSRLLSLPAPVFSRCQFLRAQAPAFRSLLPSLKKGVC
jgi:hypothetical protein